MIIFVSVDNKSISNMSKFTSILTAATVLVMAASCSTQKIAVTAHRGYWKCEEAKHAENSIASLRTAQEQGLWGSEFDVHMTNDCVLLVHHDPDIDGGRIWDANYSDFASSRLKNGERVPTLDEYLTQGEKSDKTVLVMELKKQGDKAHEDYMTDQAVEALKRHNLYSPDRVIFISFSLNICKRLAGLCRGFTVQYLEQDMSPDELYPLGINGVDYQIKVFEKHPDWIKQARNHGMSVNSWTVNKEEDIQKMINIGVDCITTNEPLLVRKLLGKKEQTIK